MNTNGSITLHFKGAIVYNHHVSARTLGKTLLHAQNAIDRAYLDLKYGNLWKYARMKGEDYSSADFIALYPKEGGFVQEVVSKTGKKIVDRISSALTPAVERVLLEGEANILKINEQILNRKRQVANGLIKPKSFDDMVDNPIDKVIRAYADRSINREIDQILSIIRSKHSGDSSLKITTYGSSQFTYDFNKEKSNKFHSLITQREIGSPVIYKVSVRELDRDRLNGKVINLENNKTIAIHFLNDDDFLNVHPFLANNLDLTFIGSPIIEYGSFDPNAGDIYYIDMV